MFLSINNKQIGADTLISIVLRYDLTPIPSTVEACLNITDNTQQLKEGDLIEAGYFGDAYKIVLLEKYNQTVTGQGSINRNAIKITAILNSVHTISYRLQRAIIKERVSFNTIYKLLGSTVNIVSDFTIPRFNCFVGYVPTFSIMKAMGEEGAVIAYKDNQISFLRFDDLFKKTTLTQVFDASNSTESQFIQRNEIPLSYSVDESGNFIQSSKTTAMSAIFLPRTPERILRNTSRCLVFNKQLNIHLSPSITAGELVMVDSERFAIITCAHIYESNGEQKTVLWLGKLSELL